MLGYPSTALSISHVLRAHHAIADAAMSAQRPQPQSSQPSAAKGLRHALSLPPRWMDMYDNFVTKNASQVGQIESALRSLTYLVPGRQPVQGR